MLQLVALLKENNGDHIKTGVQFALVFNNVGIGRFNNAFHFSVGYSFRRMFVT